VGDLHVISVEDGWYRLCQDRKQWSEPVVLTFLHKTEGQSLVLPTFFPTLEVVFIVFVAVVS